MRARLRCLLAACLGLLALGLGYAAFIHWSGWAVPCLFRQVTGWKCPGCGVTSMCLALLRLDLAAAWRWNPGLFVLLPLLGVVLAALLARYVRTGSWRTGRWQNICLWGMAAYLVGYGVLRNAVGW